MRSSRRADLESITAYVPSAIKAAIEQAAEEDNRSVSSYVGNLLRGEVDGDGRNGSTVDETIQKRQSVHA